jgi:molybdenum cofactor cytidylyltransferase
LLPFGGTTLLGHVLDVARACEFDQLICVVGGGSEEVLRLTRFDGVEVVLNRQFGAGCSSSIAAALRAVDRTSELLVLLLGDQPGVRPSIVRRLISRVGDSPLAVCAYEDGRGHPFAFARAMFGELSAMHGDKAVWKLLDRHDAAVVEVPVDGPVPLDVDTWEDYDAVLEQVAAP